VRFFHGLGFEIVGIDNNMREYFFGKDGSVDWNTQTLQRTLPNFIHYSEDIRNERAIREAVREFCPDAPFIFTSTNKVYGDTPNFLPLTEREKRWEIDESHPYFEYGIDESMSIDSSKHSVFGASKVAADVMTQEYGRYFGIKTGTFRGGCLTGPAHSGAMLHGFLAYLIKCVVYGKPYTIFGYKGKQVRDNIHSNDLVRAFWHFYKNPKAGAVYNIGGSRHSNCSVLEAIEIAQEKAGKPLIYSLSEQAREGDHIWWVSDVRRFQEDYPEWSYEYDLETIIGEIVEATEEKFREEMKFQLVAA
jgi:CDP-paratose 2-epimerase